MIRRMNITPSTDRLLMSDALKGNVPELEERINDAAANCVNALITFDDPDVDKLVGIVHEIEAKTDAIIIMVRVLTVAALPVLTMIGKRVKNVQLLIGPEAAVSYHLCDGLRHIAATGIIDVDQSLGTCTLVLNLAALH